MLNASVATEYSARGGVAGVLGWPVSAATTTAGTTGGTTQVFGSGRIYVNAAAGTHSVTGKFLTEFLRRGETTGSLRWPTADDTAVTQNGGGRIQTFQTGTVYVSPFGVWAVRKELLTAYTGAGGPAGKLGWPKSYAKYSSTTKLWSQAFQHGSVSWSSTKGSKVTIAK